MSQILSSDPCVTSCGTLLWYQTEITNGELDVRWLSRSQDRSHQCLCSGLPSANRSSALRASDQSQRSTGASWQQQIRICHIGRGLTPRIVTRKLFVTFNLPMRGPSWGWVTNQRSMYLANECPGLLWGSDLSGFHQSDHSPSHPLHEQHINRSRIVREPIHHILTSNISSIRRGIVRNYSGRERFEEFVCMFIPNKSLGSAQGAVLECKWAVMIISTS